MTSALRAVTIFTAVAVLLVKLAGCSDARKSGEFDQQSGKHESGWLPSGHAAAVGAGAASGVSMSGCTDCHGTDLSGGISGISCTACHLGGPLAAHPPDWAAPATAHREYVAANGAASCANQYCHGENLEGAALSGPSCSSCHLGGAGRIHPETWSTSLRDHAPFALQAGTAGCANQSCHGADLGGVQDSGPSCSTCHLGDATHSHPLGWPHIYQDHGPYATTNGTAGCANLACHGQTLAGVQDSGPSCTACHAIPFAPGSVVCVICHGNPPAGVAFPDTAGRHAKHLALANVTCSTCHDGAGGSTENANHYNGAADTLFPAAVNSKASTAAYDAASKSCSKVSCHGGPRTQTSNQASQLIPESSNAQTPDWLTGTINTETQCALCHVYGTAEHNGYWSGQHKKHVYDEGKACTGCHDYALLAGSHFSTLNTSTMEGPAAATLKSALSFTVIGAPPIKACNPYAGGLTTGCHEDNSWENW